MCQGVYEKEQIIAMTLLTSIAGENIFLLGPPGTAKSMVARRLKMVFKGGKSFDYLMSRFSTPDEIFGPVSISRLKNDDRYERLTSGYLPEADVVFLDEIWKAGPSIQNTLLTVINEHLFHNGEQIMRIPMKVLIAASNELPAKDEGLEALWDRFLVRMVSNCIRSDSLFFKMLKSKEEDLKSLPEKLLITEDSYFAWQKELKCIGLQEYVASAIKTLRKSMDTLEKEDGNRLRYYISDRRWRKAYRLLQASAYLNGRNEIDLTDYMILIHCFWNEAECIPRVIDAILSSISSHIVNSLNKVDKALRHIMNPKQESVKDDRGESEIQPSVFAEYDYFYYLVENYPDGETYFSKWDYLPLTDKPRDGLKYYDKNKKRFIIHANIPGKPFDMKTQNISGLTKIKIQKCQNGAIIDGVPYPFRRKGSSISFQESYNTHGVSEEDAVSNSSLYSRLASILSLFKKTVDDWQQMVKSSLKTEDNLFLGPNELKLVEKLVKEVEERIKTSEVKMNNVMMMLK